MPLRGFMKMAGFDNDISSRKLFINRRRNSCISKSKSTDLTADSPSSSLRDSTDYKAQAGELKISAGSDTFLSPLSCYFEKGQTCSASSRGEPCPVDGRPCGANRKYLDHVYGSRHSMSQQSQHSSMTTSTLELNSHPPSIDRNTLKPPARMSEAKIDRRLHERRLVKQGNSNAWAKDFNPHTHRRSSVLTSVVDGFRMAFFVSKFLFSFLFCMLANGHASTNAGYNRVNDPRNAQRSGQQPQQQHGYGGVWGSGGNTTRSF
jgi:hypothetical protein